MYFADGNGANLSGEAYTASSDQVMCVVPTSTTTTTAWFKRADMGRDKIVFTHDNTTNTTGHRVIDIAKALAEASNAGPHTNGMVDVMCIDNVNRLCIIRNKFRGRGKRDNCVNIGTWVLIGEREWEATSTDKKPKCDLLEVYNSSDVEQLVDKIQMSYVILFNKI